MTGRHISLLCVCECVCYCLKFKGNKFLSFSTSIFSCCLRPKRSSWDMGRGAFSADKHLPKTNWATSLGWTAALKMIDFYWPLAPKTLTFVTYLRTSLHAHTYSSPFIPVCMCVYVLVCPDIVFSGKYCIPWTCTCICVVFVGVYVCEFVDDGNILPLHIR